MTDRERHREETGEEERRSRVPVRDKRLHLDESSGEAAPEPSGPSGELERLRASLEEARKVADERYQQMLRLKADLENYRKRVIREQTEIVERASLRVVERLLPVLDDLERAIEAARSQPGAEGIVRGMELVHRHLLEALKAEGLERVEAEGAAFDPHQHEATHSAPGDVSEPTVLEVVRPGYRLKGRTIRPALVTVSTPSGEKEPQPTPSGPQESPPAEEGGE